MLGTVKSGDKERVGDALALLFGGRLADVCDSWVLEFGCVALRAFFSKLFDEAPSDAEAPLVLFAEGVAWSPCDLDLFARRFFLLSLSFLPLLGFSSGVVEA